MNGNTLERRVLITNPQGLHLRPMAAFAQMAGRFQCTVTVFKDGRLVNGKSMLELMSLAALQGSELVLRASGPDAEEALNALADLLTTFAVADGDEETSEPPLPKKG